MSVKNKGKQADPKRAPVAHRMAAKLALVGDCGSDPQERPPVPRPDRPCIQEDLEFGDHCVVRGTVGSAIVFGPAGPGRYQVWIEPSGHEPGSVSVRSGAELIPKHDLTQLQALRSIPLTQVPPDVADQVRSAVKEVLALNPALLTEAAQGRIRQAHALLVQTEKDLLRRADQSRTPLEAAEARLASREARAVYQRMEALFAKVRGLEKVPVRQNGTHSAGTVPS